MNENDTQNSTDGLSGSLYQSLMINMALIGLSIVLCLVMVVYGLFFSDLSWWAVVLLVLGAGIPGIIGVYRLRVLVASHGFSDIADLMNRSTADIGTPAKRERHSADAVAARQAEVQDEWDRLTDDEKARRLSSD